MPDRCQDARPMPQCQRPARLINRSLESPAKVLRNLCKWTPRSYQNSMHRLYIVWCKET